MEPIEAVLRYPSRREDWAVTLLIGSALSLLSFLIIPGLAVAGYALAVIRERAAGRVVPPAFEDWGRLLVDGLKVWVVALVYAIVPTLLAVIVLGSALASLATNTNVGTVVGVFGLGLGGLLVFVVGLLFFYVLPASLAAMAVAGRFGAAFDVATVSGLVSSRGYAVPWLWGLGVLVVGSVVGGLIGAVPLVGWLVAAVVAFYVQVVLAALWGTGYADAMTDRRLGGGVAASDLV